MRMTKKILELAGVAVVIAVAIGALVVSRARGQNVPGWIVQDDNWTASKAALQAFGERYQTSEAMFDALKTQAAGGKRLTWPQMGEPAFDWSGIYTRSKVSLHYDPHLAPE